MTFSALQPKKKKLCFGLIKIKEKKFSKIFYIFNCPVFRIKYNSLWVKYYLFRFLPIYSRTRKNDYYLSFHFETKNFKSLHHDETQLLAELKKWNRSHISLIQGIWEMF